MVNHMTTAAVSSAASQRVRSGVILLPVPLAFQGTALPMGGYLASATEKNSDIVAGVAGDPGSPTWSHPV
ncbi:MAG: hypothetical protein QOK42_2751 [Frankiaceae bacterium]|nr:hypothetical protein [Frankiaceae bacterium]MDX6225655.1 hypothetical protein [Frankiales bacterium]MDX6272815.1 hypothetical protein [Frankiales bacterium]